MREEDLKWLKVKILFVLASVREFFLGSEKDY